METLTIKEAAKHYGEKLKCKWLTPDGNDWIDLVMEVDAHFLKEMENGSVKDVCLNTIKETVK